LAFIITARALGGSGSGAGRRLALPGATLIELVVNETEGTHTLQQLLAQVSRL
jgi:2-succinyl-5-enolpyruvyl-6-hydroxy-3-cyclohexene-1-carboxylate synthase